MMSALPTVLLHTSPWVVMARIDMPAGVLTGMLPWQWVQV